jgi:hypothetical protein
MGLSLRMDSSLRSGLGGAGLGWVINPSNRPDVYLDFMNNRAWKKVGGVSTAASLLTVTRASTGYVNDSSGAWTAIANNLPRISNLGLLVEESRTNSIRNNSMQGAVVGVIGSGGALPTNWSFGGGTTAGLTATVVAIGTDSGIDTIDLNFAGTTTATSFQLFTDTAGGIAASAAQVWSHSLFVKLVGGTLTNVTGNQIAVTFVGGSGGANQNFTPTASMQQVQQPNQTAGASTTNVRPSWIGLFTNTSAVNFTIRLGWPQCELGASVTSPIRTTAAAVTRASDVVTLTSPPTFGAAYSLYAKGTPQSPIAYTTAQDILSAYFVDATNRFAMRRNSGTSFPFMILTGGTGLTQNISGNPVWAQSTSAKYAAALAAADQAQSFNGSTVTTAAAAVLPTAPTTVAFGGDSAGALPLNGFVEQAAIWSSQRLTNATLQAITT